MAIRPRMHVRASDQGAEGYPLLRTPPESHHGHLWQNYIRMGPSADRVSVEYLPAGSFASMPHGVVHYVHDEH
jgi:hypothetical protein